MAIPHKSLADELHEILLRKDPEFLKKLYGPYGDLFRDRLPSTARGGRVSPSTCTASTIEALSAHGNEAVLSASQMNRLSQAMREQGMKLTGHELKTALQDEIAAEAEQERETRYKGDPLAGIF